MSIRMFCKSFHGVLRPRYLYFDVKFGLLCPFFAKQVVNASALIKQSVQVPIFTSTLWCYISLFSGYSHWFALVSSKMGRIIFFSYSSDFILPLTFALYDYFAWNLDSSTGETIHFCVFRTNTPKWDWEWRQLRHLAWQDIIWDFSFFSSFL